MKNFCDRFAMRATTTMLSGSVRTVTSVRIQLIVSIMIMTPISVRADVSSCVRFCCRVELRLDLPAHRVDRLLRDVGHEVLHQVLKAVADDVQANQPEQDASDVVEIDGCARDARGFRDETFENP